MPVGLHLGTGLGPPNIPSAGSLKSAAQRLVQRPTSSIRLERAGSTFSERDVELYGSEGVLGPSSRRGPPMAINEYRRYAAECLLIADGITDPKKRISLLAMAQAWLKLARGAEEQASATPLGQSPPSEASPSAISSPRPAP